ncbi:hypothetical protein HIM_00668 [Hirsutella minnesotensis 3608]|nr:hypothetical protein HIM_00668 [Hirsutella minnesotensis 3608]
MASDKKQPPHEAIDSGNPTILKLKWMALDDVNVDLISILSVLTAIVAAIVGRISLIGAAAAAAAFVIPFRLLFPRPNAPSGLVLITGASSGIGAELSYIFAEKGHDLVLVGRDGEQLEAVKNNITAKANREVYTFSVDLSRQGAAQELYNKVKEKGLNVDVLVNNAGFGASGETLEQPVELAEKMITLNCISVVQLSQLFGKDMAKRGKGWILQVTSVGGWIATPHHNIYHASKHFVRAFSEALSVELRAYPGVVNTQLMPGPVHTQFATRAHAEESLMMALDANMENPKAVAMAGYKGLVRGKRMVFSSCSAAAIAVLMQLAPRSVHLTLAAIMNSPLRGKARMREPLADQKLRQPALKEAQKEAQDEKR